MRPLGAQISHMLKDRGVEVIFGIPGVHNQELYRGIEEAGLRHILARHEQGAGFMADGYARATGQPGVCYVISGPGLTNIMTPMGQAYSDSVPMLVISSCLDETSATRGQLHQMKDQEGAARAVCDWSETARTAEAAYQLIDRALSEFDSGRSRPKHVCVPIRQLESSASATGPSPTPPIRGSVPDFVVADVLTHLRQARRPLFILGGGATGAGDMAAAAIRAVGGAVMTTYAGRGLIPDDDPLNFGACLARPSSAEICAKADLILAIGTELAEVDLWRDTLGHGCPMIRVDIDPQVLAADPSTELALLADATDFLAMLRALAEIEAEVTPPATDWTPAEVTAARARWRAEIDTERPGILRVADALRACLPDGTMIYSDMTQFAYAAKEVWPMDRPGHWHHPYGFGTLGYALPAAIGGAVGRPGKPTLCIAGDYGFQYTVQELATAVELGLPLPIFLWDNGKLGEIEASMVAAQIAPNAVIQRNPDFLKLAEAYGAYAAAPQTLAQMQDAVRAAFSADAPTLIRVTPDIA